ncbi:redox-sensing transcriptional repressor Rex [Mahella sp.]|uniref:redox-sensing transcriptional repressor Rex n=1 Tax=Mahella sp. TaxID=2798721 RepID=UPI0025B952A3|nr:redox-sensing transcriptional repressor Rex [Mahella sp.]MBZ4664875.1 CoA-binding domain protein [Mahella sp.]
MCIVAKEEGKVSDAVVRRLPRYYRHVRELMRNGVTRVSSAELSRKMGLTASQIRQDFNCFGGFGQQGYGYNVEELYEQLTRILGLNEKYNTIIIGAGNIGQAIANYTDFEKDGFILQALFDINPRLIGLAIRGIEIRDIDELGAFVQQHPIDIAIIATPRAKAQEVADMVVRYGIKAIWNFAPVDIAVPPDVVIEHVHLSDSLYTLSYKIRELRSDSD